MLLFRFPEAINSHGLDQRTEKRSMYSCRLLRWSEKGSKLEEEKHAISDWLAVEKNQLKPEGPPDNCISYTENPQGTENLTFIINHRIHMRRSTI